MDHTVKYTEDDLRKAFEGGRKSVKATLHFEPFGDMEPYAEIEIVQSFKEWMHINYNKQFRNG